MEEKFSSSPAKSASAPSSAANTSHHNVRVVRLPRHGASCQSPSPFPAPQIVRQKARSPPRVSLSEQLEFDPGQFLPETTDAEIGHAPERQRRSSQQYRLSKSAFYELANHQVENRLSAHREGHCGSRHRAPRFKSVSTTAYAAIYRGSSDLLCGSGQDPRGQAPPVRLGQPPQGAWIPMLIRSKRRVARWSCWPRGNRSQQVTDHYSRSMADSTSARSAVSRG